MLDFLVRVVQLLAERPEYFLRITLEHLSISFQAIALVIVIGVPVGILISKFPKTAQKVMSLVNFLYTIPVIAMFGLLLPLVGIGQRNAMVALVIYGLLPVIRNTYVGLEEVDKFVIESARGMGSSELELLLHIKLPLAMPVMFAGIRTMIVMTIALTAIATFIGAGGLGSAIYRGVTMNFQEMIFAGSILVALLAVIADSLLEWAERKMVSRTHSVKD